MRPRSRLVTHKSILCPVDIDVRIMADPLIQVELGRHGHDLEILRGMHDHRMCATANQMRCALPRIR